MKLLYVIAAAASLAFGSPAQDKYGEFVKAFETAHGLASDTEVDRAVKGDPENAVYHFVAMSWEVRLRSDQNAAAACTALAASWTRVFNDPTVIEQVRSFIERQSDSRANTLIQLRQALVDLRGRFETTKQSTSRTPYEVVRDDALELSRALEEYGDKVYAADTWELSASVNFEMPGKTRQDRLEVVSSLRRFVELRDQLGWTQDSRYKLNSDLLKTETAALEEAEARAEKLIEAGVAADAVGIDTLVMPGVEEEFFDLRFQMLSKMEPDLYFKGGELSLMWPSVALVGDVKQPMRGFKKSGLFLMRPKNNDYAVTTDSAFEPDPKTITEINPSSRPKPSQFFLGEDRTDPYAMWFFIGSDRENFMMAEMNMAPTRDNAEVFYRSAASWRTTINGETVTFYDDDCDGLLFKEDPYSTELRLRGLGEVTDSGIAVPTYDGMQIGSKGGRVPFSSIVKIDDTWFNLRGDPEERRVGARPLNPEFFKTGEVQLVWGGNRRTIPQVLVIQGMGEMRSVAYDIASGDPVEVPVGEYEIGFGRIVVGRGGRQLIAHIFRGDSESFRVTEGETFELNMGAPFHIDFEKEISGTELKVDSTKMRVLDQSGAIYSYLHGGVLEAQVMASVRPDGRGAREVGEFIPLKSGTDDMVRGLPLLGREALAFPRAHGGTGGRSRGGGGGLGRSADGRIGNLAPGSQIGGGRRAASSPVLTVELDNENMVVGIQQLKHPLFGDLKPVFK